MQKQKKHKPVTLTLEELTSGKSWEDFVEKMPASIRKLGAQTMAAYDKGNERRMKQFIRQMKADDARTYTRILRMLLVVLYYEKGYYEQAVQELGNDSYRPPFRKILDAAMNSHVFDAEFDKAEVFDDLLPSGYRNLERMDCEENVDLNPFIKGMLLDITLSMADLEDLEEGSTDEYMALMGIYTNLYYLNRFRLGSDENDALLRQTLDYFKDQYPYNWILLEDQVPKFTGDAEKAMNALAGIMIRKNRGRKQSLEEMVEALETAYQKTYEKEMDASHGDGSLG